MNVTLESWKFRMRVVPALCGMFCVIVLAGMYGGILIETYSAFSMYESSVKEFDRLMVSQAGDPVERIAQVKRQVALLSDAVAKDPGRAQTYFELGEYFRVASDDDSLAAFINPDTAGNADVLRRRAVSYYTRALERFPTNAVYQQRLGLLYDTLGYTEKAKAAFARAEFLDPRNASLRLFLAQYFWRKKEPEEMDRQVRILAVLYAQALKGGGRFADLKTQVEDFFTTIQKKELLLP